MALPKSKKEVIKKYWQRPKTVRDYFEYLPELVEQFPLEIALSYMFGRLEAAQNRSLYCGLLKLHLANRTVAKGVIDAWRITRDDFDRKYRIVFGRPIPAAASKKLDTAEAVRDKVMHGKSVTPKEMREAIDLLLRFAASFDNHVYKTAGFRPLGDLRGFKGAKKPLDASTTKWLLKGMGFPAR